MKKQQPRRLFDSDEYRVVAATPRLAHLRERLASKRNRRRVLPVVAVWEGWQVLDRSKRWRMTKAEEIRIAKAEAARIAAKAEAAMAAAKQAMADDAATWMPQGMTPVFFRVRYEDGGDEETHTAAGPVVEELKEWLADAARSPYFQVRKDAR